MMIIRYFTLAFALVSVISCTKKYEPIGITAEHFHQSVDQVTQVMIHDIFSPPQASRIYAYPNVAAYEILASNNSNFESLVGKLTALTAIPKPSHPETINYELAALIAHIDVSKQLIFSEEKIEVFRDSLYTLWQETNPEQFEQAKNYGLLVSKHIAQWIDKDMYKQTRTMPKFTVESDDPSRWQPTPPAYMDAIEPHWNKIRPFLIDSAAQFKPIPPPAFSMEKESAFYKELEEVYTVSKQITKAGDASEEIKIAQFWDCNPYVSVTRGHLMFATKKITPGAHWIGITKIACKKSDYN